MGEGYDFVCSGEDDIMVADDGAASDGTDADLFLGSAFSACTAVVDVFVFVTNSSLWSPPVPVRCRWERLVSGYDVFLRSQYQIPQVPTLRLLLLTVLTSG